MADFDDLLNDVIADSSKIDQLTDEQVVELRKKISPYGRTVTGEKNLCCMSVINVKEEYMKKWLTTALIGFLFRGCDEYLAFDTEPTVSLDDLDDDQKRTVLKNLYATAIPARDELAKLIMEDKKIKEDEMKAYYDDNVDLIKLEEANPPQDEEFVPWQMRAIDTNAAALREQQMKILERIIRRAENMSKRFVVREFLDTMFTFNPDVHIRGAYGYNPLDPERKEVKTKVAKKSNATWKKRGKFDKIREAKRTGGVVKNEPLPDVGVDEFDADDTPQTKTMKRHIPPADTYFKLNMYLDDFHDQIKSAVRDIYHEKADIEWAINPYRTFEGPQMEAEAKAFVHKHSDEVLWNIETLYTNHWNLMGAFSKNKERTDFLNNNTEIITEYLQQVEKDKKMGRELMVKKAQRKKLENVGDNGPDTKAFRRYKSEFATSAESMGAVDLSDYKQQKEIYAKYQSDKASERERLANVKRAPNGAITADTTDIGVRSGGRSLVEQKYPDAGLSAECPDDGVQVDVINMMSGGLVVEKSNFFTEAVAPQQNPSQGS